MKHIIAIVATGLVMAACTSNGKLQQYIENNNISLAGQQVGPGMWCDGMTIDRDTVVITYRLPEVEASAAELANWDAIAAQHKLLFLEGLSNDKSNDPEGSKILTDAGVYMKGVFKYANASLDVMVTPEELAKALE